MSRKKALSLQDLKLIYLCIDNARDWNSSLLDAWNGQFLNSKEDKIERKKIKARLLKINNVSKKVATIINSE